VPAGEPKGDRAGKGAMPVSDSSEVIVVASKVKAYIKSQGDMKTSANVLQALSNKIRSLCDEAIETARSDGRKTVLDRDIP
jgi:histone H3/H4